MFASDIDEAILDVTRENAKRAGVDQYMKIFAADARGIKRLDRRGTVVCNPPYGERLLDVQAAEDIYRQMGKLFKPKQGWSYAIISPHEEFETLFGRKADKRRKLYNGMLKCQLYMYFK